MGWFNFGKKQVVAPSGGIETGGVATVAPVTVTAPEAAPQTLAQQAAPVAEAPKAPNIPNLGPSIVPLGTDTGEAATWNAARQASMGAPSAVPEVHTAPTVTEPIAAAPEPVVAAPTSPLEAPAAAPIISEKASSTPLSPWFEKLWEGQGVEGTEAALEDAYAKQQEQPLPFPTTTAIAAPLAA